ncbi:MAG: hypothetical protein AAB320_02710 [Elusimicrobiota bacterium]
MPEIDRLYLHRHEGKNLELSQQKLDDLLKDKADDQAVLWRLGRGLVAVAAAEDSKEEKVAAFKAAEAPLKAALKLAPGDAQAHYWLARQMAGLNAELRTLGLARSMKKELEAALRADPGHAAAHRTYGELLHQLPGFFGGDQKKAVREIESALRLAPDDTAAYPALAEAYLAVQETEKAVAALKGIFAVKEPADPASYEGDLKDARALLRKLGAER